MQTENANWLTIMNCTNACELNIFNSYVYFISGIYIYIFNA